MRNVLGVGGKCFGTAVRSMLALGVMGALLLGGCSPEGAVSVTGTLDNVQLTLTPPSPFVAQATGGFDMRLYLGSRADSSKQLSFSALSLVRADSGASVLAKAVLGALATNDEELALRPGDTKVFSFVFASGRNADGSVTPVSLSTPDWESVCGAGSLQLKATLHLSGEGSDTVEISSGSFAPVGCEQ